MAAGTLVPPAARADHHGTAWHVFQQHGEVRVEETADGGSLDVRTGADGQVTLVRGDDVIHVLSASRLVLPVGEVAEAGEVWSQEEGRAIYGVDRRDGRTLTIRTPYLATLVKGTTLDLTVAGGNATVMVTEGHVDVTQGGVGAERHAVSAGELARFDPTVMDEPAVAAVPARLPDEPATHAVAAGTRAAGRGAGGGRDGR